MLDYRFETVEVPKKKKDISAKRDLIREVTEVLDENHISFETHSDGNHIRIPAPKSYSNINYYCSTGSCNMDGRARYKGKGLNFLIDLLREEGYKVSPHIRNDGFALKSITL